MVEYIERGEILRQCERMVDLAVSKLKGVPRDNVWATVYSTQRDERSDFCALIRNVPTADVAPVVHGKIIETMENGKLKRVFSCCGGDFTTLTAWMIPNFCPGCGAKIDGGFELKWLKQSAEEPHKKSKTGCST